MDALKELIQNESQKQIAKSACIASVPCVVVENLGNQQYKVATLGEYVEYILTNYSGSYLNLGETVQVFYRNGFLSNQTAYIGAACYKGSESVPEPAIVQGFNITGNIGTNKIMSLFKIYTSRPTNVILSFNSNIKGLTTNDVKLTVVLDSDELEYEPKATVHNGEITHLNFSIPLNFSSGTHTINIVGNGSAQCLKIESSVYGLYIVGLPVVVPTGENDYIYETLTSEANPIFYIGETDLPLLPMTLNGKSVKKIRATTFDNSEVISVVIPDGITTIE